MKRIISFITAFAIIMCGQLFALADIDLNALTQSTAMYLYEQTPNPTVSSVGGEWAVIGIAASGADVPGEYFDKYLNSVCTKLKEKNGILSERRYTEYARVALALSAIGADPQNIGGYDLISPLTDTQKTSVQGINGAIWALIAIRSGNYCISDDIINSYENKIISAQNTDGGWSLSGTAPSDTDITAMALCALAGSADGKTANVRKSALNFLSSQIIGGNLSSSENISQVITALCRLGISLDNPRYLIGGRTLLQCLADYLAADGGFCHEKGGSSNQMSTEQALTALASLKRISEGKPHIYTGGEVKITNSDKADNPYAPTAEIKNFSDTIGHYAENEIGKLAAAGIINGKDENTFDPDNTMTRAEFAAITTRALGLKPTGTAPFADVGVSDWFSPYVACAYENGIVNGISDTLFAPNSLITNEEAAVMVMRAAKLCGTVYFADDDRVRDALSEFDDYMSVSSWAKESVAFCCENGIIPKDKINLEPQRHITRAEVAVMIYNMITVVK